MGWLDNLLGRQTPEPMRTTTLADVIANYDVVEVAYDHETPHPYLVVSAREDAGATLADPIARSAVDLRELGSSSPSPFVSFARQEYNVALQGLKGLEQYDRMRKSDGVIRGQLRLIKTPPLAGRWFVEPASDKTRDVNVAEFVTKCLTEYMSVSWNQVLTESLLMCDFGYYMFEKVWEERVIDGKNRLVWKKLAPRHPMDVKPNGWDYDANGGPAGVHMFAPGNPAMDNGATFGVSPTGPAVPGALDLFSGVNRDIYIPIDKLLVFTFDREAGNLEGISVLRSAYKHWYYKEQLYKIDAIQKERHGIGIPVIVLPVGFTEEDKTFANELGRNLRTNERAHVVLPPNWVLEFAKLEGQPVDALASIKMHDDAIRSNILSEFLGDAGASDKQNMFLKATRFVANVVCDTFNDYAIKELVDYNYSKVGMPKLKVRRIGEEADWRTISFALRNLVGAGLITPDEKLEEHLRQEMDLPKADKATRRQTATPQNPNQQGGAGNGPNTGQKQNAAKNQAGLPRQSLPSAQPPKKSAGTDQSGGK